MTIKARVRDVGGVLMLELPESMRRKMELRSGSEVDVEVSSGTLTFRRSDPYSRLQDLLKQCDPEAEISDEDREWERMEPVGRELL